MSQLDLPPVELPSAVARAAQVRADREADLGQAQRELREARLAVETAIIEDRAAYASARDAGGDDPGPLRERAAREEVEQAQRRLSGEQLRLGHAEDELGAAVAEHVDAWAAKLGKVWEKADAASLAALQRLSEAEQKRDEVRSAAAWLAAVQETGDVNQRLRSMSRQTGLPDGRNAGGHLHLAQLLAAVDEYVMQTGACALASPPAKTLDEIGRRFG